MKANEFVKEFGWEKASSELSVFQSSLAMNFGWSFVDDLKRLVESHELVESCGGLKSVGEKLTHGLYESRAVIGRLEQAIADVESCQ